MISAQELIKFPKYDKVCGDLIRAEALIAHKLGLNYIFVDKKIVTPEIIDEMKELGYSVVIGQGDQARIKISW